MFASKEMRTPNKATAFSTQKRHEKGESGSPVEAGNLPGATLFLQRNLGNSYLQSALANKSIQRKCACGGTCASCSAKDDEKKKIQAKLKVGPANDVYEQEADRVATQVMRMPDSEATEDLASPGPLRIRRLLADGGGLQVPADFQISPSGGRPLSATTRQFMEPRFGVGFGHVRLHSGEQAQRSAAQIHARAFTYGNHITLGKGESENNTKLMAHELTHVVQQRSQPKLVNKKVLQRMRRATAADTAPACTDASYVVPPAAEHSRVDAAIAIIDRVVNDPANYPRCPTHFEDNCSPGSATSLEDQNDRAIVWKIDGSLDLGGACGTSPNIAYTDVSFRPSKWSIAASLVHEMMHICGVAGHPASTQPGFTDILDEAKHWCGRLPNI